MKLRQFLDVVGVLFILIAAIHGLRIALRWEVTVDGWVVPYWVSGLGLTFCAILAWTAFRMGHQKEKR